MIEDTRVLHAHELARMAPGERKRYLADMAARNHRLAMRTGMNKSAAFEAGIKLALSTRAIASAMAERSSRALKGMGYKSGMKNLPSPKTIGKAMRPGLAHRYEQAARRAGGGDVRKVPYIKEMKRRGWKGLAPNP